MVRNYENFRKSAADLCKFDSRFARNPSPTLFELHYYYRGMKQKILGPGSPMPFRTTSNWRISQVIVWLVGIGILFNLIFYPKLGIHLFWNILIPVAPALLVVAIGVWRNVCPLATSALLPARFNFSKGIKLSRQQTGTLNLISVIALLLIAPLRHTLFDTNGLATAILIISVATLAFAMGSLFEWKSGWCSSLCPIHPVEKLYGQKNGIPLSNAQCGSCFKCVAPCPDSTPGIHPMSVKKNRSHQIAGFLMVGAFPGFIWGWFQVPDATGTITFDELLLAYLWPLLGMLVSGLLFYGVKQIVKEKTLVPIFSALSVSCYYWFRIPALVGYGMYPHDGMLIDLSGVIPHWLVTFSALAFSAFFFWWFVFRQQKPTRWGTRPAYAEVRK